MILWLFLVLYVFVISPAFAILAYIALMHVKNLDKNVWKVVLPWWVKAVLYAALAVGWPGDVLLNATYGAIRFKEWDLSELTLTSRLQRYRKLPDTDWRKVRALRGWSWLNLFDPGHW